MKAFAAKVGNKVLLDTVYEYENLSKMHWLAFSSGDYDQDDFLMLPGRLKPEVEFENYPEASIVSVSVSEI